MLLIDGKHLTQVSAEIQNINTEGSISLHTRSFKYGKLENGQLITVPCNLVKR